MIQLQSDCLVFNSSSGQSMESPTQFLTIELIGEGADQIDPDVVRHASAAVLHYFKKELGRSSVSISEFSEALEAVMRHLGLTVGFAVKMDQSNSIVESDLQQLAFECGQGFELAFFPRLRGELRKNLKESPRVVLFQGLRGCVKQLAGARRWSARCQQLSDQIVDFLRFCWKDEVRDDHSALMVC
jgi:hypothetical protein